MDSSSGVSAASRMPPSSRLLIPDEYGSAESKILLTGPRKGGKTSILRVLLKKMPAHETVYLEGTSGLKIEKKSGNRLLPFRFAEMGGSFHWEDKENEYDAVLFGPSSKVDTVVIVLDASDEGVASSMSHSLSLAKRVMLRSIKVNPKINIVVFLHKYDRNYRYDDTASSSTGPAGGSGSGGMTVRSDQKKTEFVSQWKTQLLELVNCASVNLSIYCTSIFDDSLQDVFSSIVQRSLLKDGRIENLLDLLTSTGNFDKSYLIDKTTRILLATDNSPDPGTRPILSDVLDLINNVTKVYASSAATTTSSSGGGGKTEQIIGLSTGQYIYLKMLDDELGLVVLIRETHHDRIHLLNRNINTFWEALQQVIQ